MLINQLNLNQLKVFGAVCRKLSMTEAAAELHLTQSGVSQHISGLERDLNVRLFDRVKRSLIPTPTALALYNACQKSLDHMEQALRTVSHAAPELKGRIHVGMPIEFGNQILMPVLARFLKNQPGVTLKIRLGLAPTMDELLLRGELDFAFVDSIKMSPGVEVLPVYSETLELYATPELLGTSRPRENRNLYDSLPYVEYQDREPLLKMWFRHHKKRTPPEDRVRAVVMDVQGIARLVCLGVGAGVLPTHVANRAIRDGAPLVRLKGSGRALQNSIGLARIIGRTQSLQAEALLTFLGQSRL